MRFLKVEHSRLQTEENTFKTKKSRGDEITKRRVAENIYNRER